MKYRKFYITPKYSDGDKTYYGSVDGVADIPMIEAKNLDDFERLFHQAVDEYLEAKGRRSNKMVGWLIALGCVVALLVTAVLTCPDKQAHKDAIMSVVKERLKEDMSDANPGWAMLGQSIGSSLSSLVLETGLTVENHFIYSVGKYDLDSEKKRISFGLFGHVFTIRKKDLDKYLDEYFN